MAFKGSKRGKGKQISSTCWKDSAFSQSNLTISNIHDNVHGTSQKWKADSLCRWCQISTPLLPLSSFPHSLHPQSPFRLLKFHLESGEKKNRWGDAFILGGGHFKIVFGTQRSMCAQAGTMLRSLGIHPLRTKGTGNPEILNLPDLNDYA